MRIILLFSFLILFSCQTLQVKKNNVNSQIDDEETQKSVEKVDSADFTVSLKVEEYQEGKLAGMALQPKLDPRASYIAFEVCTIDGDQCTAGEIDGLAQEVIYDAPNGELQVSYQACVTTAKALKEPCGPKKSLLFTHTITNIPPLYLTQKGGKALKKRIRKEPQKIQESLQEYISHSKHYIQTKDSFDVLIDNLLSIDHLVLGRLLESKAFQKHLKKVRAEVEKFSSHSTKRGKDSNSGIGILSLGSSVVVSDIFKSWKKGRNLKATSAYVKGVEDSLRNLQSLGLESETMGSVIGFILNSELLPSESDLQRKKLLDELATIETDIELLKSKERE